MKIFFIVAVCIIATLHECTARACRKCTSCLNELLNVPAVSSSSIDQGECPSNCTFEYHQLQLIELLFRQSALDDKTPCKKLCVACRKKTLQTCNRCSINPGKNNNCAGLDILKEGPWHVTYNGMFFPNATAFDKAVPDVEIRPPPFSAVLTISADKGDSIKASAGASAQSFARASSGLAVSECDDPCKVDFSDSTAYTKSIKIKGKTWYPLRFRDEKGPVYQYYRKVSCPSANCPTMRYSLRTFVFSTEEPVIGVEHSLNTFNFVLRKNIKFFTVKVPGYCEKAPQCK